MKLKQMETYVDFIRAVQDCEGDVYFCSAQGDQLNLQSRFCQILFASICGDKVLLEKGSITCLVEKDYLRLKDYLTAG